MSGPPVTRFQLLRHGEVERPWRGRIYGNLDVPLSDRGRAHSRALAERLAPHAFSAVVSSGLPRAEFAARLVREGREPRLERNDDPRLTEVHRGDWAGLGAAELEAREPGAWARFWAREGLEAPPGGERLEDVRERVLVALDDWAGRFPGGAIAVVAHKWVLRVAVCAALDLPLERAPRIHVPLAGAALLEWPAAAPFDPRRRRLLALG